MSSSSYTHNYHTTDVFFYYTDRVVWLHASLQSTDLLWKFRLHEVMCQGIHKPVILVNGTKDM